MIRKQKKIQMNNNGITLIALSVTIIVLLILASISISVINGDNSIVKQATEAQILTELNNVHESIQIYIARKEAGSLNSENQNTVLLKNEVMKEVEDTTTGRKLGIVQDFDKLKLNSRFGKGYKKVKIDENGKISSVSDLYNVYAIDLDDNTLYYIKNEQVWSIDGINNLNVCSERIKFITEWTTTEDNQTIELPLEGEYKVAVEWGDGQETIVESATPEGRSHTYEKAGVYNVKIRKNIEGGQCKYFMFKADWNKTDLNHSLITNIIQWGELDMERIQFHSCINLKGPLPSPTNKSFINITSFENLFSECIGLTGTIPSNLFKNATKANNFAFAFSKCQNLTGSIPGNLFEDVSKEIVSFSHTFSNCDKLSGTIPANLFKNKRSPIFIATFQHCKNITQIGEGLFDDVGNSAVSMQATFAGMRELEKIPKDLFKYNTEVTDFQRVFDDCIKLKEIPDGIFSTNVKVADFDKAFYNCQKITSKIKKSMFANEVVKNDVTFDSTFMWCINITGVEQDLFENYPNVTDFTRTFNQCHKISGAVPEIWKRTNVIDYSGCFVAMIPELITNWDDIPDDWKYQDDTIE